MTRLSRPIGKTMQINRGLYVYINERTLDIDRLLLVPVCTVADEPGQTSCQLLPPIQIPGMQNNFRQEFPGCRYDGRGCYNIRAD